MSLFCLRGAWLAREAALEFQYRGSSVNNIVKGFPGGVLEVIALLLDEVLKTVLRCSFRVKYSFNSL